MLKDAIWKRISLLILLIGPLATIAVSPFSNFDPINLIKLLFVTSLAFSLLGFLFFLRREAWSRLHPVLWLTALSFLGWMLLVMIMSDSPLSQQFWGVFGRNTGFLTYLSLVLVLLATATVQDKKTYHKLVEVLVLTGLPMTVYAVIQLAGRDPIAWSEQAPFATLGNINFSSAFFGLAALCTCILISSGTMPIWLRLVLGIAAVVQLALVLETGSIQGFMIFVAGLGVAIFVWLRSIPRLRLLQIPYLMIGLVGIALTVLALFNTGPLARFVFQNTILFRFDYWYAGWMMSLKNPVFGIGMDSYGDWYRQLRGEVATLRTGPDRITNTAHNIYLDLSASGGFPLLFLYLVLLFFAGRAAFLVLRREKTYNPYFTALFAAWIAYLIQAGVSINQIGVGIWGWLFTGGLIGYEVATRPDRTAQPRKAKSTQGSSKPLPAAAALLGIFSFGVGFVLAFVPFRADAGYRSATESGDFARLEESAQALGASAYHYELVLDTAIKKGDEVAVGRVVDEILQRYPRNFMAWRVRQVLTATPPSGRVEAYNKLKALDPYNPSIIPSP